MMFNGKGGCGGALPSNGFAGSNVPLYGNPSEMDWLCRMCRERNFSRRGDCFKCHTPRSPDAELVQAPAMTAPPNGTTLKGMVKSYNKKGFGFIMVFGSNNCHDVFYTRENVSSKLMHPDMPGEQVTFEIYRERGKLVARNIRPLGDDKGLVKGHVMNMPPPRGSPPMDDGQWRCPFCNEHNFARRLECFKCKVPKPEGPPMPGFSDRPTHTAPPPPRRTFSPHAGARAIRESLRPGGSANSGGDTGGRSSSSSSPRRRKVTKKKRKQSSSSRSSSSSDRQKKKKKGKTKRSRSRSSSSSRDKKRKRSRSSSSVVIEDSGTSAPASGAKSEIDKAKAGALEQLTRLQTVEPKEVRMSEFRALLREWHPDKNPDRVEVATAVFQFLQKGKALINM